MKLNGRHAYAELAKIAGLMSLWLLPVAMLPVASGAEAPFSFDSAPGRLPKTVVPGDYEIAIVPDVAKRTFTGRESVHLQVRTATTQIIFNTLDLRLRHVTLDGVAVQNVATDNDAQLTTLTLAAPAAAGAHELRLSYDGVIQTRPQGLFVQPYSNADGGKGVMLTTQMEATDARRLFPCWDEPAFRATFQLSATIPAAWAAVSNMPIVERSVHGKVATVRFQRSPRMPTYLVDFNAAEHDNVKFGVWAIRGHEQDGAAGLANTQQILADYGDYFGYPFPLPKLDSIAIPGGFSGAMENWGAITYNSTFLLMSKDSSLSDRQETDLRNPAWKWWEGQDADKESAMHADAQSTSHAIQVHVVDEQQASSAFDPVITYSKGQAVLRMLESYLGEDTFRDGVRRYIKARAFSNATSGDLWQASRMWLRLPRAGPSSPVFRSSK